REHVQYLELRSVCVISPRHPQIPKNELREKGQMETYEDDQRREPAPQFRIHPAGNLGPPEMQASDIGHNHSAHHDVVEVSDHKVCIVNVNIQSQSSQEQPRHSPHGEQADEAEGIQHGSGIGDLAPVHGGSPVEDFNGRRNRHHIAEKREDHGRVNGNSGHKLVVGPYQETKHGYGNTGHCNKRISEYSLARETRHNLAHHPHARQNHDVNSGVRRKPEEVLKQHRISADFGVENSNVKY